MSDDSFTEIDSIDDFSKVEIDELKENGKVAEGDNGPPVERVIFEMPSEVFARTTVREISGKQSQDSSIASSFLRGVDKMNLNRLEAHKGGTPLLASRLSLGRHGDEEPSSSASSIATSAWSCVASNHNSKSTCDSSLGSAMKKPKYGTRRCSEQGSVTSVSYEHVPAGDSSTGSLGSKFDVISLSSGKVCLRCTKCKYNNPADSSFCAVCDLALVANPCLDHDEQIARNLQEKEKNFATLHIQERERKRERLSSEAPIVQATFFTEEVESYVRTFVGFRTLPWEDLRGQAMIFIVNAVKQGRDHKVNLGFVFTRPDDDTFDAVRQRGLAENKKIGFGNTTNIGKDVDDAWNIYTARALFSITETDDDMKEIKGCGWIVAFNEFDPTGEVKESPHRIDVPSHEILPLVSFASYRRDDEEIQHLLTGMKQICGDFFDVTLGLDCERKKRRFEATPLQAMVHHVHQNDPTAFPEQHQTQTIDLTQADAEAANPQNRVTYAEAKFGRADGNETSCTKQKPFTSHRPWKKQQHFPSYYRWTEQRPVASHRPMPDQLAFESHGRMDVQQAFASHGRVQVQQAVASHGPMPKQQAFASHRPMPEQQAFTSHGPMPEEQAFASHRPMPDQAFASHGRMQVQQAFACHGPVQVEQAFASHGPMPEQQAFASHRPVPDQLAFTNHGPMQEQPMPEQGVLRGTLVHPHEEPIHLQQILDHQSATGHWLDSWDAFPKQPWVDHGLSCGPAACPNQDDIDQRWSYGPGGFCRGENDTKVPGCPISRFEPDAMASDRSLKAPVRWSGPFPEISTETEWKVPGNDDGRSLRHLQRTATAHSVKEDEQLLIDIIDPCREAQAAASQDIADDSSCEGGAGRSAEEMNEFMIKLVRCDANLQSTKGDESDSGTHQSTFAASDDSDSTSSESVARLEINDILYGMPLVNLDNILRNFGVTQDLSNQSHVCHIRKIQLCCRRRGTLAEDLIVMAEL